TVIVSPVSYYEVTIRPAEHPRWTNANVKQCVSVGVCLRSWKQRSRGQQAGWCKYSWGLHGDDGNLFHGSGMHHSVEAFSRPFGAGDTIGEEG
ncbi:Rsp5p-dependent ubiquitination, sorting of cargo proteins at the multivesicular body, partial [Perkinsus olseni]